MASLNGGDRLLQLAKIIRVCRHIDLQKIGTLDLHRLCRDCEVRADEAISILKQRDDVIAVKMRDSIAKKYVKIDISDELINKQLLATVR